MRYTTKEILEDVKKEIKEHKYITKTYEMTSNHLDMYSFGVEVSYNENFSENVKVVVENRVGAIIETHGVNIKDIDWLFEKLEAL